MLSGIVKKVITMTLFTITFIVILSGFTYAQNTGTVIVTANILNLREAPNTSSKVLGTLSKGNELKVSGSSNGWYKVTVKEKTGWVSGSYVTNGSQKAPANTGAKSGKDSGSAGNPVQTGAITGNNVNVRKGPGLNYGIITQLNKGDKLTVLEASGVWYKAEASKGIVGWISSTYITISQEEKSQQPAETVQPEKPPVLADADKSDKSGEPEKPEESAESSGSIENSGTGDGSEINAGADEIIEFAKSLLGIKYTYGGNSPETGFDCSGFMVYVFGKFGVRLERVAADQAGQGAAVSKEALLPGDLVFFDTNGGNDNISHVGLYMGDGNFIDAGSGGIVINNLNTTYWLPRYMTAKRIL